MIEFTPIIADSRPFPVNQALLIIAGAAVAAWLVVEFRPAKTLRIVIGVLAISLTAFCAYRFARTAGDAEQVYHAMSLKDLDRLFHQGDTNTIRQALDSYEKDLRESRSLPEAAKQLSLRLAKRHDAK